MTTHAKTIARITGKGRFVWWPATQMLSFVPLGKQRPCKEWHLTSAQNNDQGALAKIGRILAWEGVD